MIYHRHGATSHFMRPDGVMRTSVIQPTAGYYPTSDVMAVAQEFTSGPYWFSQGNPNPPGMPTNGMGGLGYALGATMNLNPLKRFWLRLKARAAAKKASAFMRSAGMHGLGQPWGAAVAMAPQINSEAANRFGMLAAMAERHMPPEVAPAYGAAVMQRWLAPRFFGNG